MTTKKQKDNHTLKGISITVFLLLFIWGSSYGLYYIYINIEKNSALFSALFSSILALLVISGIIVFMSGFLEMIRIIAYKEIVHSLATIFSTLLSITQIMLASAFAIMVSLLLVSHLFSNVSLNPLIEQFIILTLCSVICILFYIVIVVKILRKQALKLLNLLLKKLNIPIESYYIEILYFPNLRNQQEITELQKSRAFFERLATFILFYYAILSGWINPDIKTIFDLLDNQYAFAVFVISFSTYSYCAIFSLPFINNEYKE